MNETNPAEIRELVRARYAAAARRVTDTSSGAESLPIVESEGCCSTPVKGAVSGDLYAIDEVSALPSAAVLASLGCGNPTALAELAPGETVLDLGSGGGIDVLLSARRVGPTGLAYGLDMTDEMLALAQRNAAQAGATNVAFLKGHIEAIPLPNASVDVVISNCVINLSADKAQVLREAFRVLKPGGRFAVSDVVVQGDLPAPVRLHAEMWAHCIAGALQETTYRQILADAGFEQVDVAVTRVYDPKELARESCSAPSGSQEEALAQMPDSDGRLVSAFVRGTKPREPVGVSCCPPTDRATCCGPEEKAMCCGAVDHGHTCGCE